MLDIDNGVSLVKFGATWCAPCKLLETTIGKIKQEFDGVNFVAIDVDDNPDLAKNYKIKSVPTVILFRNGIEISRLIGAVKTDALRKALRDLVNDKAA
jgi:thioredoxin 1